MQLMFQHLTLEKYVSCFGCEVEVQSKKPQKNKSRA